MDKVMEMRNYSTVGRSMQATAAIAVGTIVLKDTPVLRWSPTGTLPLTLQAAKDKEPLVPQIYAAAAAAFLHPSVSEESRKVVLDMHVPNLPISEHTLALYRFAAEICPDPITVTSLVHAMIAAKVNAHRAPSGDWCLFPLASKFAHSCDANMFYHAASFSFVALRPIAQGELLTFSYLAANYLAMPTEARQKKLMGTHMFTCACPRCHSLDKCRRLRCPACTNRSGLGRFSSSLVVTDADFAPTRTVWACEACGHGMTDASLEETLEAESSICEALEALASGTTQGYRYKDLRALLSRVKVALGEGHWAYAKVCYHFALYFRTLAMNHFGDSAVHMFACWGFLYLMKLESLGVWEASFFREGDIPHPLVTSFLLTLFEQLKSHPKYRKVLTCLGRHVLPFLTVCYGSSDVRVATLQQYCATGPAYEGYGGLRGLFGGIDDVGPKLVTDSYDVDEWLLRMWDTNMMMHMWRMQTQHGTGGVTPAGMSTEGSIASSEQSLDSLEGSF